MPPKCERIADASAATRSGVRNPPLARQTRIETTDGVGDNGMIAVAGTVSRRLLFGGPPTGLLSSVDIQSASEPHGATAMNAFDFAMIALNLRGNLTSRFYVHGDGFTDPMTVSLG